MKVNNQIENTLRYRLCELHTFLKENEIGPRGLMPPQTWWDYFVDCMGDEAESWFDEAGKPLLEWDGIWHKDV